jgi:hypothetical protein
LCGGEIERRLVDCIDAMREQLNLGKRLMHAEAAHVKARAAGRDVEATLDACAFAGDESRAGDARLETLAWQSASARCQSALATLGKISLLRGGCKVALGSDDCIVAPQ